MPKKSLLRFIRSLSMKVALVLILLMIVLFTLNSTLCYHRQLKILEENVKGWAFQTGNLVKEALYRMMLFNRRDDLHQTILTLGKESDVERVRIYNKQGEIKFSNREHEIEQFANLDDKACRHCHHSNQSPLASTTTDGFTYIFYGSDEERVLEVINPILNNPDCSNAACHFHKPDQKMLGVLNIQMSLKELDQSIYNARRNTYLLSVLFVLFSLLLIAIILYFTLHVPFRNLRQGTEELANGNLDYRIDMNRSDELGWLAKSFNNMAESLQQAYQRLKAWSSELENRVQNKTEQLERMHQGMMHVEKMASLGTMAATVAHELNNPLTGIVTYAKLLQKQVKRLISEDQNKQMLNELELIRSESLRCGNIVRDLLLFARESSAKFNKNDLGSVIDMALNIVRHHLALAKVNYQVRNELHSQSIVCDSSQLGQAFIALFVNAVEAMPNGGKLDVYTQSDPENPDRILIQITDSGTGIPDEIKEKIFEPFYSTKKNHKGVGLGLAVVYGIIQRHKGNIWVESQEDRGTTFFINLPVDPTQFK